LRGSESVKSYIVSNARIDAIASLGKPGHDAIVNLSSRGKPTTTIPRRYISAPLEAIQDIDEHMKFQTRPNGLRETKWNIYDIKVLGKDSREKQNMNSLMQIWYDASTYS
jgi:hypothetical protein